MNRTWMKASAAMITAFGMIMMMMTSKAEPLLAPDAASMAVIECESGCLLAEQNKDMRLPMASTTKIMTALIVLENCDINEQFVIPDEAVGTEGSSMYLGYGERVSVKDLLYGLMLASGNDAAVALAVHVGGDVKEFVDMMNKKAEDMGLERTHFVTPNGLHSDEHLTTAYELCLIAREALKNEVFREITSTKYYKTETGDKVRTLKNKNSLLWDYEGAFGVKTGYTMAAGRCLVFGAERDGMTVVGTVLNCRPMFETAAELLDEAFETFSKETVVEAGQPASNTYIKNSIENILEIETKGSIITVMRKDEKKSFNISYEVYPDLTAPIFKGEKVGVLNVYDGGELVGSTELVAKNDVHLRDYGFWWRLLSDLFAA